MKYKFNFTGAALDYFLMTLGCSLLAVITLGLAMPFIIIWNVRFFSNRLEIVKVEEK